MIDVFILAAGLGTRLRPLTNKYPKPSVPFLNVPMGLYPFRFLNSVPVSSLTVNTFHLPEKIKQVYSSNKYSNLPVSFSDETGFILGSAGGLKKAEPFFKSQKTVLMLNADEIFFPADFDFLKKAYQRHVENKNLATLVTMKHPEAGNKFGAIWCDQSGRVHHIGKTCEDKKLHPHHYIGMIFIDFSLLKVIPENQEVNVFYDLLINHLNQSVEIYNIDCSWYETGNAKDYLAATKDVLLNADGSLLKFINQYDPSDLIKNENTVSLVSKKALEKSAYFGLGLDLKKVVGYNCIAGSSTPELLSKTESIKDSVLFENEFLNLEYFS